MGARPILKELKSKRRRGRGRWGVSPMAGILSVFSAGTGLAEDLETSAVETSAVEAVVQPASQEPSPTATTKEPPPKGDGLSRVDIVRLNLKGPAGGVVIDGKLDEPIWQQGTRITDFKLFEPVEVGTPPGKTEVRVFYTDEGLYLGFHCQADNPAAVRAHLAPREDINNDDQVGIYLDTFDDDRQAYVFYLNVLGIQQDARLSDSLGWNQSWDTVLDSKGRRTADGYVVEVMIPFRSLRFPNVETQHWGLILTRKFAAQGSKAAFPSLTHQKSSIIAQAAHLDGIQGIRSSRNLEIGPELSAGLQYLEPVPADPDGSAGSPGLLAVGLPEAGVNARYGLSSNVTLDFTLNPDFSQVESDPSQLDLNHRYALFYDERRPFFLEGAENFPSGALSFYSRSVVDPLFGLKVTGKEKGITVGMLTALDQAPFPSLVDVDEVGETPGFRAEDLFTTEGVLRPALVTVARIGKDLGNESVAGISFSDKEVLDPGSSKPTGYNRLVATDFTWKATPQLQIHGQSQWSHTGLRGETPLKGGAWFLTLNWNNRLTSFYYGTGLETPEFRSETAFLTRPGRQFQELYFARKFEPPVSWLSYTKPQLYFNYSLDVRDQSQEEWSVSPGAYTRFAGQRYLEVTVPFSQEVYAGESHRLAYFQANLLSQYFDAVQWQVYWNEGQTLNYGTGEEAYGFSPKLSVTVRPTPWLVATGTYARGLLLEDGMPAAAYLIHQLSGSSNPSSVVDQHLGRLNLNVNFSSQLSLRMIGDLNRSEYAVSSSDPVSGATSLVLNRSNRLYGQMLFAYVLHPGTAAYLGVTHTRSYAEQSVDGEWQPSVVQVNPPSWLVFLKLAYLWRV